MHDTLCEIAFWPCAHSSRLFLTLLHLDPDYEATFSFHTVAEMASESDFLIIEDPVSENWSFSYSYILSWFGGSNYRRQDPHLHTFSTQITSDLSWLLIPQSLNESRVELRGITWLFTNNKNTQKLYQVFRVYFLVWNSYCIINTFGL